MTAILQSVLQRVLIAEDDPSLRQRLVEFIRDMGSAQCRACGSVAACLELLPELRPTLLILDFQLTDGTATRALRSASALEAWPCTIVISGTASSMAAFEMGELGARAYLEKPISPKALRGALERAVQTPRVLEGALRSAVGTVSIHAMQERVRDTMLAEALGRSQGNRRAAARLLQISRQLIQHMVRAKSDRTVLQARLS